MRFPRPGVGCGDADAGRRLLRQRRGGADLDLQLLVPWHHDRPRVLRQQDGAIRLVDVEVPVEIEDRADLGLVFRNRHARAGEVAVECGEIIVVDVAVPLPARDGAGVIGVSARSRQQRTQVQTRRQNADGP